MGLPDGREEISATLVAGSWKGVPIYFNGGSVSGGRKATAKPIFNSDEQDVSDVGGKQRSYSVRGFVSARYKEQPLDNSTGISSDYHEQRANILAILEEKGPGVLIHPFEGEVRDLIVMTWTLDESMNELGIGQLSIEFAKKTVGAVVKKTEGSDADTEEKAKVVDMTLLEELALKWEVDLSFIQSFEDAFDKMSAVYDSVQAVVDTVENVAAEIDGFATAISDAVAELASIITAPLAIVTAMENIFASIDNIFPTLDAAFSALSSGFGFGDDDDDNDGATAASAQRAANFGAINTVMKGMFLSRAYVAATGLDLSTLEKIEEIEAILDAQHDSIVTGTQASPEVKESMQVLRESFFRFLSQAKLTALKVTTETVPPMTPRVLAFQLYGETDLKKKIAGINGVDSFELLSGEVQVLSR